MNAIEPNVLRQVAIRSRPAQLLQVAIKAQFARTGTDTDAFQRLSQQFAIINHHVVIVAVVVIVTTGRRGLHHVYRRTLHDAIEYVR
jgi:hypothetical protein